MAGVDKCGLEVGNLVRIKGGYGQHTTLIVNLFNWQKTKTDDLNQEDDVFTYADCVCINRDGTITNVKINVELLEKDD